MTVPTPVCDVLKGRISKSSIGMFVCATAIEATSSMMATSHSSVLGRVTGSSKVGGHRRCHGAGVAPISFRNVKPVEGRTSDLTFKLPTPAMRPDTRRLSHRSPTL